MSSPLQRTAHQMEDDASGRSSDYPRKRAAIACNVCRLRKTRCDGLKPSCSFCSDLGIACQYRGPNQGNWSEEVPISTSMARLEQRFTQFENNVVSILRDHRNLSVPSLLQQQHSPSRSEVPKTAYSPSLTDRESDLGIVATCSHSLSTGRIDIAFRQTRIEAKTARPGFLTFKCPPFLQFDSWDETERFYDDELRLSEVMFNQTESLRGQPLDTSTPTCWRLQQSFLQNYLRWIPLYDVQTCVEHVKAAKAMNFEASDLSSCMALFILAVGSISDDRRSVEIERQSTGFPPGLEYFARASDLLGRFTLKSTTVEVMQCRVLQAAYFHFLVRPVQVWNSITQVSRDCMHVFTSSRCHRMDSSTSEALNRVFWACSMIQHEIEATLKMHPIGVRHYHSIVPLPSSEAEEDELYYFLAQASLRRLLTEAIDAVGFHSGKVIYAPIIVQELRAQLQEWYKHLPPPVQFSLEGSPLFDTRNAFLRSLYIAVHVVLNWPSTLRCLEWGVFDEHSSIHDTKEWENMRANAREHLYNCYLYIEISEELLLRRSLGLHSTLWSVYAILTMLIIVHNSPIIEFAPETKNSRLISKAYNGLRSWDHMPLVARGLERTRTLLSQAGIYIDLGR